jgi:hypothetical protein
VFKDRYTFKRAIERTGENADEVLKDLVETMWRDVDGDNAIANLADDEVVS